MKDIIFFQQIAQLCNHLVDAFSKEKYFRLYLHLNIKYPTTDCHFYTGGMLLRKYSLDRLPSDYIPLGFFPQK